MAKVLGQRCSKMVNFQIEVNGDAIIINDASGRFQRKVKHHFGGKSISYRDTDFRKTHVLYENSSLP